MNNEDDTKLLLEYMILNGFSPRSYHNILELNQTVNNSLSKYLKDYKQFLLSTKVNYQELLEHNIKGARGYLDRNDGIVIPKSIMGDDYFKTINPELLDGSRGRYKSPDVNDFYYVISNGFYSNDQLLDLINTFKYNICERFFGLVVDRNSYNYYKVLISFKYLFDFIKRELNDNYVMESDKISSLNKEIYLIKKK